MVANLTNNMALNNNRSSIIYRSQRYHISNELNNVKNNLKKIISYLLFFIVYIINIYAKII